MRWEYDAKMWKFVERTYMDIIYDYGFVNSYFPPNEDRQQEKIFEYLDHLSQAVREDVVSRF